MKRLLLVIALLLAPAALFAQVTDRDVLLSSDGTLYTIESKSVIEGDSNKFLQLTVTKGSKSTVTYVPETLTGGTNWRPALAFDSESSTLFVFWIGQPNSGMYTDLEFASYRDGKWQPAVAVDERPYHTRNNLRIAITRRVSSLQPDGSFADAPALLVHATWWESGAVEEARYALFTIENSEVSSYEVHDLSDFAAQPETPFLVDEKFNPEILRHPALVPGTNSVDVIFGDAKTNSMNRVTLKPIADGRVHIPIGNRGGHPFPPPQSFSANWTGRISTISSGSSLVLYNTAKDFTSYILFDNGTWSDVRTLAHTPTFGPEAAVAAIGRMVSAQ